MSLLKQVKKTVQKYNLLETGDKVLVAVSGGPDSLALLDLLNRIKADYKLELNVAHVDHKLRGEAARRDALFVEKTAEKMEIPFFLKEFDVAKYQQEKGLSLEAAAREIRYDFFESLVKENSFDKIALAHHANDQAETLLIKFLRGSGLQGLKGILPKNDNLIRPLIEVERLEIENYCKKNDLEPRLDETNLKAVHLRNQIRLELIPLLEKEYNSNLIETLNRSAKLLREDNNYLTKKACEVLKNISQYNADQFSLKREDFLALDLALQRRVIREIFKTLTGDYKDLYFNNIQEVISFIKTAKTGTKIDLPANIILYLNYNDLIFTEEINQTDYFKYKLEVGKNELAKLDYKVKAKVVKSDYPWYSKVNQSNQAYLDFDKIGREFYLRQRKAGDRFYPLNLNGSKKVKDFLIDEKVPRFKRAKIPIFTTLDDEIFWLGGYRIDDRFKITANTEQILAIEIIKP